VTVFLRDMSHYDGNESLAGFVGTTHKITEGTSFVDPEFARRLNAYHAAGVKVLGSYHVLHTGSLAGQLDHWLSTLDALTPWWRAFPGFIMQIDAERWATDNVSPDTVKSFARLLVGGAPGYKVTYASRGQYGNGLAGIATDLWNAAYRSATYPGDNAADWAPYSGKTPVLWQYTDTPYDKNAYRGSLNELLALIGGTVNTSQETSPGHTEQLAAAIQNRIFNEQTALYGTPAASDKPGGGAPGTGGRFGALEQAVADLTTAVAALTAKVDALAQPPLVGDLTVTGTLHVET
jgi:hypothetical protein